MKFTGAEVRDILHEIVLLVGAISALVAAWRGIANGSKLAQVSAKTDAIHTDVKANSVRKGELR